MGRDAVGPLGRDAPGLARQLAVAVHARLRRLLDHRRDVDPEVVRLPHDEDVDGARKALEQRVGDRLVDEHARGGGALLARVDERRGDERRHRVVEVGVRVDDDAVLAAHLRNDPLEVRPAHRNLGGRPDDLEADGARPGERDRMDAWMADERRPGVPLTGKERHGIRRDTSGAQRLDDHQPAPGRLLGRLEDGRVAGDQRRGDHAHRDRHREVPGRDDRGDAARDVAHRVVLAGHLQERAARLELDRAARVELEEVDRLADVGVGLAPWLRALADLQRGQLGPALAHPRRGAGEDLRAPLGRRGRPLPEAAVRRLHGVVDVLRGRLRRDGDDPFGVPRIG